MFFNHIFGSMVINRSKAGFLYFVCPSVDCLNHVPVMARNNREGAKVNGQKKNFPPIFLNVFF